MKRVFTAKQFTIKCEWYGSRIKNGPDWCYRIWFNAPNGKTIRIGDVYFKKADAQRKVSECCRIANMLYEERENDPAEFERKYKNMGYNPTTT